MKRRPRAPARRLGIIFILSAPSGAGKTTLYNGLRRIYPEIALSVSCTTRRRRPGEVNGRDYRFLTERQFDDLGRRGEFAEWAKVHDYFYGTPRKPLERCVRTGRDILLDIDVQGARQIKAQLPSAVGVFILPPSMDELSRRLRGRATDDEPTIQRRFAKAKLEIEHYRLFDYVIVNDDYDKAFWRLRSVVYAESTRCMRMAPSAERLLRDETVGPWPFQTL